MREVCIDQPVSWLRLEMYALGALDAEQRSAIEAHINVCAACAHCLSRIEQPQVLPTLKLPERAPSLRIRLWQRCVAHWPQLSLGFALASVMLLSIWPKTTKQLPEISSRVRVRGGEIAITLLREHQGMVTEDPKVFKQGDRFKVLVTCPPQWNVPWRIIVLQGKEAFQPLPTPTDFRCGNKQSVPGAFTVDGDQSVDVCLMWGAEWKTLRKRSDFTKVQKGQAVCQRVTAR